MSRAPEISNMTSLKVDNITYRTTIDDLKRIFDKYGEIGDVYIPRDRRGESRGYAFVRFHDRRDAEDAMDSVHGKVIDGRELRVQMARYGRPADRSDRDRSYRSNRRRSRSPRRYRSRSPSPRRRRSPSPRRSRSPPRKRYSRSPDERRRRNRSRSASPSYRSSRKYDRHNNDGDASDPDEYHSNERSHRSDNDRHEGSIESNKD